MKGYTRFDEYNFLSDDAKNYYNNTDPLEIYKSIYGHYLIIEGGIKQRFETFEEVDNYLASMWIDYIEWLNNEEGL